MGINSHLDLRSFIFSKRPVMAISLVDFETGKLYKGKGELPVVCGSD